MVRTASQLDCWRRGGMVVSFVREVWRVVIGVFVGEEVEEEDG